MQFLFRMRAWFRLATSGVNNTDPIPGTPAWYQKRREDQKKREQREREQKKPTRDFT